MWRFIISIGHDGMHGSLSGLMPDERAVIAWFERVFALLDEDIRVGSVVVIEAWHANRWRVVRSLSWAELAEYTGV